MRQGGTSEDEGARRFGGTSRDEARELDITSGGKREMKLVGTRVPSRPGRTGGEEETLGDVSMVGRERCS